VATPICAVQARVVAVALASTFLASGPPARAEPAAGAGPGSAQPGPRSPAAQAGADLPVASCLEQTIVGELQARLRPRGVQARDFTKDGKLALTAHGGLFAGDLLSSSYLYGGALALFFTEDLGLELRFDRTHLALDIDAPLAEFFGDDRFESGAAYLALANLAWSPVHAKMKVAGSILHSDLLLLAGAGRLIHDSIQGVTFDAGVALELFTSRWVTLRIDIRDIVTLQEAVAETRLTNNLVITGGLSLWIPVGL
jgi:outer membrane beta-barrel protein